MNGGAGRGDRPARLIRFYEIIDELSAVIGGPRTLAQCDGRALPPRGVYFFMEHGESRPHSGRGLRIVRVGTHAISKGSRSRLWGRLSNHRGTLKNGGGNHRGSIFRLLVGEALANLHGLDVPTWGRGSTAGREVRERELPLERLVSVTIQRMPFLWLDVPDEPGPDSLRAHIERNAIALLSNLGRSPLDPPSPAWLGLRSRRRKVRESGLWNQNHVEEEDDPAFLERMAELVHAMKRKAGSGAAAGRDVKIVTRSSATKPADAGTPRDDSDGMERKAGSGRAAGRGVKVVIQCAARKRFDAGTLRDGNNRPILFVARPELAPPSRTRVYARPDDPAGGGRTWRDVLEAYVASGDNPYGLLPAWELYENPVYGELVGHFGMENVFILSAGWGLVRADFPLPDYDITLSTQAEDYKRRRNGDTWRDFRMLPADCADDLVFFGSRGYAPLFAHLTHDHTGRKIVFYKSSRQEPLPGCELVHYDTTAAMNWHYRCARDFMAGKLQV